MNTTTMTKERRQDRLIREHDHDPYKAKRKLPEPTVCPQCGAIFRDGRWQWTDSHPYGADQATCQACNRIADHYPAGIVTVSGGIVREHKTDILNLVQNMEDLEKPLHPLHRIMSVEERADSIVVNTTDIHLPRRIGEALRRAHKGDLEIKNGAESHFVRVNWRRE